MRPLRVLAAINTDLEAWEASGAPAVEVAHVRLHFTLLQVSAGGAVGAGQCGQGVRCRWCVLLTAAFLLSC